MSENTYTNIEAIEKLHDIIKEVKIAMMTTKTSKGKLQSRPMSTAGVDYDGTIWFFTNDDSKKVKEVEKTGEVCLSYSNPSANTYASINGIITVDDNKFKKEELWNNMLKAWFPLGLKDPNLTLLKITPTHGDCWDITANKVIVSFNIAKAAITGNKVDMNGYSELKF